MRLNLVIMAFVAAGCGSNHLHGEMSPELGGNTDGNVDEHAQDGGLIIDEPAPMLDAGRTPDAGSIGDEPDTVSPRTDAEVGDDGEEDAGEASHVGMCTGELAAPATFGTAQEPIELAAGDGSFEGQIDWRGRAFARITGVTAGTRYVIEASAASKLVLSAFPDDTTFTEAACVSGDGVNEFRSLCLVTAASESIGVAIDALYVAETFTLTIKPAYPTEGTLAAPVQIAASALPYDLEVNSEVANFYEITGLTPGTPYAVSARAELDYVALDAYAFGAIGGPTDQQVGMQPRVIGVPLGTSLIVAVRAGSSGATAELDVRPATHEPEGTESTPIQIAASTLPFEGEVGWSYSGDPRAPQRPGSGGSGSYYTITGLTPGAYVLKIDGATTPVFVILEDDGSMSSAHLPSWVRADEGGSARIATRITGSTLDVLIKNQGGDGTSFTLDIEPAARTSAGSEASPLEIPLAAFPYSGEIEPNIYSYYEITGLTPGQRYLARATDVNEAAVGIYFPNTMPGQWACEIQAQTGTSDVTCTVIATETTARFQARVFGYTTAAIVGGVFTLSLDPIIEESVGTALAPVAIDCSSGTYTGQIGTNGESYYEITGLEPGAAYSVEVTPSEDDIVINVFTGDAEYPFSDSVPCNNYGFSAVYPARCVSTSAAGSLFVQVIGYARGRPFELSWRRSATGSEGTQSAPVALVLEDLPFTGQVSGARPSFYTISGLEPGAEYLARIAPVEELIDMHLYQGSSFEDTPELGGGPVVPGEPFEHTFIATDTNSSLKVALPIGADGLGTFGLDISPQ